jgi:hypothetical protein
MNHHAYLENYQDDLLNSQKTSLLIELTPDDIKRLKDDSNNGQHSSFPVLIAQNIYNQMQENKVNNLLKDL